MLASLFTLVLAIFSFTGLASSSVPALTCAKGSVYHVAGLVATRCCGGHHYRPGYQRALEEHFDSCNKEPADKTETLAGSQWALYSCLMEHLVGEGQPATFKSVAEAMAGNMTGPEKAKILEMVEKSERAGSIVDWGNKEQVQSAWTAYFDAEFEVCKDVLQKSDWVNATTAREQYWEPSFMCMEAKLPYIIPFKGNFIDRLTDCMETMKQDVNLNATTRREPVGICILITTGALTKEDLRNDKLDVDSIINQVIPKTLSALVVSETMNSGKFRLAKQYGGEITGTETLSEMAEKIAGNQKMTNIDESDKKFYLNLLALDKIVSTLANDLILTVYDSGLLPELLSVTYLNHRRLS